MSSEFEIIKQMIEENFNKQILAEIPQPCFIANSEKMFEFAKEYFKDTDVKVLLNMEAPKDTCYIVSKGDVERC